MFESSYIFIQVRHWSSLQVSQPSPGHFTHWFIKGFLRVPEGHFDSHTPSEVSTVVCEQIKQWIVPSLGSEKEKDALMLVFKRNGVTLKKIFC